MSSPSFLYTAWPTERIPCKREDSQGRLLCTLHSLSLQVSRSQYSGIKEGYSLSLISEYYLKQRFTHADKILNFQLHYDNNFVLLFNIYCTVHSLSCKHFNIDPTGDGQFSMGTLTFASIEEVIHHYQQNSLFIHDGHHVTLGQPAKKRTRGSDASKYNPSH